MVTFPIVPLWFALFSWTLLSSHSMSSPWQGGLDDSAAHRVCAGSNLHLPCWSLGSRIVLWSLVFFPSVLVILLIIRRSSPPTWIASVMFETVISFLPPTGNPPGPDWFAVFWPFLLQQPQTPVFPCPTWQRYSLGSSWKFGVQIFFSWCAFYWWNHIICYLHRSISLLLKPLLQLFLSRPAGGARWGARLGVGCTQEGWLHSISFAAPGGGNGDGDEDHAQGSLGPLSILELQMIFF